MWGNGALTALLLLLLLKIQVIWDATLRRLHLSYETSVTMNQSTRHNVPENPDTQQNLILLTFPLIIVSRNKILKDYYYYYYYYYYLLFVPWEELGKKARFRSGTRLCRSSTNCCKVKPTSANVATLQQHNSEPVVSYRLLLYF